MEPTTDNDTAVAEWLKLGERLVVELHRRRGMLNDLCPERNYRRLDDDREMLKKLSTCELQIGRVCMRMAAAEEGFGVTALLDTADVSRRVRCAVTLMATSRLSNRTSIEDVADVMELAAGASVVDSLLIRDEFLKGGLLYAIAELDHFEEPDVVDKLRVELTEASFQVLLGRDPTFANDTD